ncbi:MAG: Rieske 2Fe-2S domain-containing protein [Reyranella sp.]|nr:Rieske 2Fe-2S domain-containing protein [Reyranella sp.]
MNRTMQTEIAAKLFTHMAAKSTDLAPEEMYQPTEAYIDPAQAAREREALFRKLPLIVCHASELPQPHDFVTADLVGVPVLIVRQPDGSIRAFTNVCRHRGSRLVTAERGNARLFVCPFHAWTYEGNGALRNIAYPDGFCGVDRQERGLIALPVEQRHGLVWVVPTPGAAIDVAAHLGAAFDAELAGWKIDNAAYERSQSFELPINWKLVMDGFMEDYHLTVLHKSTIGPYMLPNIHEYSAFRSHSRLVAARASMNKLAGQDPKSVDLLPSAIFIYSVFPGTILVWQADHFELWTILPHATDPRRATATARLLAPTADTVEAERALWDKNWKILMDTVQEEDWAAARDIQESIGGGGQSHFVFGRNEPALQHFHREVARATAA